MNWLTEIWRRITKQPLEDDLAEEMRLHIDLRTEQHMANGESPEQARAHARQRFGNTTLVQESSRGAFTSTFVDTLSQDIRYGIRALAANPSFTWTAILTLALGIGANTAIFSLVDTVLFRSLPLEDPQALVQVQTSEADDELNLPFWQNLRADQQVFSRMLAYAPDRFDLSSTSDTRLVQGMWVSGGAFEALGVPMYIGRGIEAADDRWGKPPVAVISYAFWQSQFLGSPDVLGKTVNLNRQPAAIVGVTPPWFTGLDIDHQYQVAIPIGAVSVFDPSRKPEDEVFRWWLRILGRLAPGVSMAQAKDQLATIAPEVFRLSRPNQTAEDLAHAKFLLKPAALGFSPTRTRYRTALYVLMATVALLLLIACANIANLLLARSSARQRELSVRMAIGAGRFRIVRQLMTESLILASAGTALGFFFAIWGSRGLVRLISTAGNPLELNVTPDARLLGFAALLSLATALLFGLAPALRSTRFSVSRVLKENEKGAIRGASRFDLRKALLAFQLALSLILLIGTGLFLSTFRNLLAVDTGFLPQNVVLVSAKFRDNSIAPLRRGRVIADILDRLRSEPGVRSAATSLLAPIGPAGWLEATEPEGYVPKSRRDSAIFFNRLSPGYFETLRTPILHGRDFNDRDTLASNLVIILNETAARKFFPNANPLGKTISIRKVPYQVIGVARDSKYNRIDEAPRPVGYLTAAQDAAPSASAHFHIRTDRDLNAQIPALRAAIVAAAPDLALEFHSFESRVSESLTQPRAVAQLSMFFGAIALLLSIIGVFGLTSYAVTQRKAELGIRTALGARQSALVWLVLKDTALLLVFGLIVGVLGSLALSRYVKTLLFNVTPDDPQTYALTALLLAVVAALAAFIPARRAARLDPMSALREE
ncbi:ABC transporter permease [Bryobacter aggregatus]|uniref:ABC transporter permease n=1 Tax=Bryobacter aggregatus TaxID=360054 RepID=UPI0006916592|nr:ABC transporter permease [Bryobacter aggregatus]